MKILIIDDEDDIRAISRLALGRVGGMDVVDAASGKDGIAKAITEAPDAILLDVMMPDLDGPETFGALKGDPRTAHIPVIFLTAKAMAPSTTTTKNTEVNQNVAISLAIGPNEARPNLPTV